MFTDIAFPGIDFPLIKPVIYIGTWGVTRDALNALRMLRDAWGTPELGRELIHNGMSTSTLQVLFGYMGWM